MQAAEDEVGVGHGGSFAAAVAGGAGMAPADCGPTCSAPAMSIHASEPPPAPAVWMSSMGTRRAGRRPGLQCWWAARAWHREGRRPWRCLPCQS